MQKRTYLVIPKENKTEALRAAGRLSNGDYALEYDRSQKVWFAKAEADLEKVKQWLPENTTPSLNQTSTDNLSPAEEFAQVLQDAGFIFPAGDLPEMDGKKHRVFVEGQKHTSAKKNAMGDYPGGSGVYQGFLDGRAAGWYQNHRASEGKVNWTSTGSYTYDPTEVLKQRALAAQKRWDREMKSQEDYARIAKTLSNQWSKMPNAPDSHAYLARKGVPAAAGVKLDKYDNLVIPLSNTNGELRSLQYIKPDGTKNLKKGAEKTGNFFVVGGELNPHLPFLYAEGYATAKTLNQATGIPVIMTVDAGNMVTVSRKINELYPDSAHIILGEDDFTKDDNKGLNKAREAADAIGGTYIIPQFTESERTQAFAGTGSFSDFNDIHTSRGIDAVREQLAPVLDPLLPHWRKNLSKENIMPSNFEENRPQTIVSEPSIAIEPNKVEPSKAEHKTITLYHGSPAAFSAIAPEKIGLGQNFVGRGFYTDAYALGGPYVMEEINHQNFRIYELEIPSNQKLVAEPDKPQPVATEPKPNQEPDKPQPVATEPKPNQEPDKPEPLTTEPKPNQEPDKPEPLTTEPKPNQEPDKPEPTLEQNTQEATPVLEIPEQPLPDSTPISTPKTLDIEPSDTPENAPPAVENGFSFTFGRMPGDVSEQESSVTPIDLDKLLQGLTSRQEGRTWIYSLDGQDAFRDYGDRIVMATPEASENDRMILAALLSAKANQRGAVEITGSDEFIQRTMGLIADHNIDVHFKNPQQREQFEALLKARAENAVPKNGLNIGPESTPEASVPVSPAPGTGVAEPALPDGTSRPKEAQNQPVTPELSVQDKETLRTGLTGKLLDAGMAPYKFDKSNSESFYVQMRTKSGNKTYWGVELEQALKDSGNQPGDMIKLQYLGKKAVTINVPVKDAEGNVKGFERLDTHRNHWTVTPALDNQLLVADKHAVAPAELAAYDGNAFWKLQQQIIQNNNLPLSSPTPSGHGLLYTSPDGKGQVAPEVPPVNAPVPNHSKAAGSVVMAALDDKGELLAHLVKGHGDYLQGVIRHEGELKNVLARICTTEKGNTYLALNSVQDNGVLQLIGHASAVNTLKNAEVNHDTFAFQMKGKDAHKFAVPLISPEKIPPALHSKLGFSQAYAPPKSEEPVQTSHVQAKPAIQPQPM